MRETFPWRSFDQNLHFQSVVSSLEKDRCCELIALHTHFHG